MELVISIVIGILMVEAYAWLPKLSEWLIDKAVQPLRNEDRDRCREEWKAGLEALPNTLIRLVHALSYVGAAHRINTEVSESKLVELDALIEECIKKRSGNAVVLTTMKERLDKSQSNFRQKLDTLLLELKTHIARAPNKSEEATLVHQKALTAFEGLANNLTMAIGRSIELLTVRVDRINERLNHVHSLILKVSEKRDQLTNLLGRRDVSPNMFDALIGELTNDLQTVQAIFADDNWGDEDSLKEYNRISSAIGSAVAGLAARGDIAPRGTQRA
jgi:hypothetical protein